MDSKEIWEEEAEGEREEGEEGEAIVRWSGGELKKTMVGERGQKMTGYLECRAESTMLVERGGRRVVHGAGGGEGWWEMEWKRWQG